MQQRLAQQSVWAYVHAVLQMREFRGWPHSHPFPAFAGPSISSRVDNPPLFFELPMHRWQHVRISTPVFRERPESRSGSPNRLRQPEPRPRIDSSSFEILTLLDKLQIPYKGKSIEEVLKFLYDRLLFEYMEDQSYYTKETYNKFKNTFEFN